MATTFVAPVDTAILVIRCFRLCQLEVSSRPILRLVEHGRRDSERLIKEYGTVTLVQLFPGDIWQIALVLYQSTNLMGNAIGTRIYVASTLYIVRLVHER